MTKGCIVIDTFESTCLKNNPLKDPFIRNLIIYLPPDYVRSKQDYPVLFLLSGFSGKGIMFLNQEAFSESIDERLNRLIQTNRIEPMIVVMPDCFTYYGGSQYRNSHATGNYETYLVNELVPYVKKNYRVKDNRSHWAIAGKSSGGYGALTIAMRHCDIFGILACHSGDMGFEYCYQPDFPQTMIEIEKQGGILEFMQKFYTLPKKDSNSFLALNIIAMAAAYSSNKKICPHFIDFPFDLKTGELRSDVWQKWLNCDPIHMLNSYENAVRQLKIFIDCGIKDEYRLYAGSRIFSAKLKKYNIDHVYEEFNDTHMKINYRYDRSLEFISESMS